MINDILNEVSTAWNNNKFKLLLILIPVILILIVLYGLQLKREYIIATAQKLLSTDQKKDEIIQKQVTEEVKQADKAQSQAKTLDDKIKAIESSDDADWNKK